MELVLGVSMTATTIRAALVEGEKADGVIVDHDVFDITAVDGSATPRASDEVIATILGTQESAIDAGHHLVSIGVTWMDRTEAAALREGLVARGLEDVLLVSELHAAAALAQAVGRAVGYDKTGLMFVERETATLAVVETADGSVVKVLRESLHGGDAIAAVADMVSDSNIEESQAQGLLVVGSGIDVAAVRGHVTDLVAVPVIAPEEPHLALARGAALASASAPRYDPSTIGLAYSQDSDGTTAHQIFMADLLHRDDAFREAADIDSTIDDVPERSKPFLLVGSSLTAVFVAGMLALTIAVAVNIRPTADQGSEAIPAGTAAHPQACAVRHPPSRSRCPRRWSPPHRRRHHLRGSPLHSAKICLPRRHRRWSCAMPRPPQRPPPAPPPPVVVPPAIPPPIILFPAPWNPPILRPPPRVQSPQWYPGPSWPRPGHGGSGRGHGGGHGD